MNGEWDTRDAKEQFQFCHNTIVLDQSQNMWVYRWGFIAGELLLRGEGLDIVGSRCQIFVSIEVREANGAWQQFGTDQVRGH